ncbi:MAG: single-stranded DNA-binding protein [Actinomycetia bacterium]|nr:single-stranded DNA-binding protein [Actinomycetes bacterium]
MSNIGVDSAPGTAATLEEPDVSGGLGVGPTVVAIDAAGTGTPVASDKPADRLKQLEAEGDAGADYLEELLDIVDLDGDIDIFVENGRASLAIEGDGDGKARLQRLVGRDGQVLEALQELTRMAVQAVTGERTRLVLDIGGWRESRRREAAAAAERVIAEVRGGAASVELAPMPAYQRKVVHDLVADAGLRSESAGVEPSRHVVVSAG